MSVDIPTVLLLEILCSVVSALVLASALRGEPGPGTREATVAMVCLVPGFAFYMARAELPVSVSSTGANVLLWMSAALVHRAILRFASDRRPDWWPFVLIVAAAPVFVVFSLSERFYGVRVLFTSLILALMLGAAAYELARQGGLSREPARRFAFALLGFGTLGLLVRIGVVLPDWNMPAAPLAPSLETTLAFVPSLLIAQGFGPAFMLMQRERSEQHARALATTDALTGCLNRRALEAKAEVEVAYAARKGAGLGLAIVDLDHFKRINDTHGHAVGDVVLSRVGELLRASVRPGDLVARYGGEEFCVLLRDATLDVAIAAGERLCALVRATTVEAHGAVVPLTASVGVASLDPRAGETWDALFRRTDALLYRAKRDGRDRVVAA